MNFLRIVEVLRSLYEGRYWMKLLLKSVTLECNLLISSGQKTWICWYIRRVNNFV